MKFFRVQVPIGGSMGIWPSCVYAIRGSTTAGQSLVYTDLFGTDDHGGFMPVLVLGTPEELLDRLEEVMEENST